MDPEILKKVEALLAEAGEAILSVYGQHQVGLEWKADHSPVTLADRLSSGIINRRLAALFPDIPVIDEETEVPPFSVRKEWPCFFLLDPLDGTKEFLKKNGEFCINLALMENNLPVVSWIYHPVGRRGWFCQKGKSITAFGEQAAAVPQLQSGVLVAVTSRSHLSPEISGILQRMGALHPLEIRATGSSLKQVQIALGEADLYLSGSGTSEWDTAAGHLMAESGGGKVTAWDLSTPLLYNKPRLGNPRFVMLSNRFMNSTWLHDLSAILQESAGDPSC